VHEIIERFATRQRSKLTEKTLYEYRQSQDYFEKWVIKRKNAKNTPLNTITRADIADFIDDLKNSGISDRTIQGKYLASVGGLFELAISSGSYADANPCRGHKVFTKLNQKKLKSKTQYKPFEQDELKKIFDPANMKCYATKPDDWWVPILGLYTGARIEEICQLDIDDIQQIGNTWSLSINDEDDTKSVKTEAARRKIPVHPDLIKLGFLDYVEDAKAAGNNTKLFPHLTPDRWNKFSNTTGERFGGYLDKLGISDPLKVFHSFRKTVNNTLKQAGVGEEIRCQLMGHEHETTNSFVYGQVIPLDSLSTMTIPFLDFPFLNFEELRYTQGMFTEKLQHLVALKRKKQDRKVVVANREAALQKRATNLNQKG